MKTGTFQNKKLLLISTISAFVIICIVISVAIVVKYLSRSDGIIVISNASSGFSVSDASVWSSQDSDSSGTESEGLLSDDSASASISAPGKGDYAKWLSAIDHAGYFNVYAKWTSAADRATNAKFTVYDGSKSYELTINQKQNGGAWYLLGTYFLSKGSFVTLSNDANGFVSADSVKFEPISAVEQWKIKELTFSASKFHSNPYSDIYADVQFRNGTKAVVMPMFWDGGNTWKVRFAPPITGTWTWSVVNANNAALADAGITGSSAGGSIKYFQCIKPAASETRMLYKHGFIKIADNKTNPSADRTYMTYDDGTPFFWSSYIPVNPDYKTDFWGNNMPGADPGKGQFQMSIDQAKINQYNVVKFLFLDWFSPFANPNKSDPYYPYYPAVFPNVGIDRNFDKLNPEAVTMMQKEVDTRMDYMASKGMVIELESCYADKIYNSEKNDGVYNDRLEDFKKWYRYLYARYGAYPITLSPGYELPWYYVGGDIRKIRLEKYNELYDYCDSFVQDNRPLTGLFVCGGPISASWNGGNIENDYCISLVEGNSLSIVQPMQHVCFSDVKNPSLANSRTRDFYSVFETYYAVIERNRLKDPSYLVRPIISDETGWEGAPNPEYVLDPDKDVTGLEFMSLNMWKSAMVSAGTSYGMVVKTPNSLWWYKALYDYPGQVIGSHIQNLFNNPKLPWWKMHPILDEEYLNLAKWTNPNIPEQPWQKPDIRTDYKRDFPDNNQQNHDFLIYFPRYAKGAFDSVKEGDLYNILQKPGVTYYVTWYNPTKGGYKAGTSIKTYSSGSNGTCLQIPSKPDNNDWILWLSLDKQQ